MSRIFVSYRRSDAAEARQVYDRLVSYFGEDAIFLDAIVIAPGENFADRIDKALEQCEILLVLIGRRWLESPARSTQRRLDNSSDWIRLEIESFLNRDVHVIPVLLDGASVPIRQDLPKSLRGLLRLQFTRVRKGSDFLIDMAQLIEAIQRCSNKLDSTISSKISDTSSFMLISRQETNQYYEEVIAEGVIPLRMMRIPSGTFLMGSPDNEFARRASEGPQHGVSISQFFMSKYPVTQTQWQAVAAMSKVNHDLKSNPSHFKGALLPVESISWYEAVEFCDRLTLHTNRQYRLPTEAEWEYACRADTTTPFYFGETITTDLANYRGTDDKRYGWSGSYGDGPKGEYRKQTTPVSQFDSPNAYGLCDMHGNIREWCQDHWHRNYKGAPSDGSAWLIDNEGVRRVLRGGSWANYPMNCRSAYRHSNSPVIRYLNFGFRVSCVASRALE
ncbi:MAG: SUMF1/EgtB/PvdO family nonheme iron enzyme [Cyanobacteria bacterium J06581_3]